MEGINSIELVIKEAEKIINDDFINYVNKREFEIQITKLAQQIDLEKFNENAVRKTIEDNLKNNKPLAFVIFFTFYTIYRRTKYGDLAAFCNDYISKFSEYEITEHIKIITDYVCTNNANSYDSLIKRIDKLINKTDSKFSDHAGVLNLYAELVCSYYERNLDLREGNEDKKLLQKALNYINSIIAHDDYPKHHLNKGRLLILLKNMIWEKMKFSMLLICLILIKTEIIV